MPVLPRRQSTQTDWRLEEAQPPLPEISLGSGRSLLEPQRPSSTSSFSTNFFLIMPVRFLSFLQESFVLTSWSSVNLVVALPLLPGLPQHLPKPGVHTLQLRQLATVPLTTPQHPQQPFNTKHNLNSQVCSPPWQQPLVPSLLVRSSGTESRVCSLVEVVDMLQPPRRHPLLLLPYSTNSPPESNVKFRPRVSPIAIAESHVTREELCRFAYGALCVFPDFTKCLEKADLPSCQWYLDQLKAVSNLRRFHAVPYPC